MNLIVVVDKVWGIGRSNDLLFHLPKDMAFFRQTTTGKVVVMGANTFASFPHGALPNRTNIVLDNSGKSHEGTITVDSVAKLSQLLANYLTQDVFVLGGASLYKLLLPYCTTAYVTKVDADGGAEVFFPDLDTMPAWSLHSASQPITDGEYTLTFCQYVNSVVEKF